MTIYTIIDGAFYSPEVSEEAFAALMAAKKKRGRPRKVHLASLVTGKNRR